MIKSIFLIIALFSTSTFADRSAVIKSLSPFFGPIDRADILDSPFPGVFEVITHNPIESLLISKNGKYLIQGDVVDLATRKIMPASNKINQIKLALLATIDNDDKIIFAADDEKYIIDVFTDIDCPFCQKLHAGMDEMNAKGITVRYLASPLASLHPTAQGKMEKIWCADDRADAIDAYKKNKTVPEVEPCNNPVAKQLAISKQLGVTGTPAIFLSDGTHLPGYLSPTDLLKIIQHTLEN